MKGYHFVGATLRDGSAVPADGIWLNFKGPVECCFSGYHMSEHPADALPHAPGPTLCLVNLDGDLQSCGIPATKWVGRRRQIIRRIDATPFICAHAVHQVLSLRYVIDIPTTILDYLISPDPRQAMSAYGLAQVIAWPKEHHAEKDLMQDAREAFGRAAIWLISFLAARDDAVIKSRIVQYEVAEVLRLIALAGVPCSGALQETLDKLAAVREDFRQKIASAFDVED